jgi:hypothetical protein
MNFLFGKKNFGPSTSVLPLVEDTSSMLINVDQSLLSTRQPVTTKPFDVTAIMPKEFKSIRGSSFADGSQGILSTSLLKNEFLAIAHIAFDKHLDLF